MPGRIPGPPSLAVALAQEAIAKRVDELDRSRVRLLEPAPDGGWKPKVLPAVRLLEDLVHAVVALDDVTPQRPDLFEEPFGHELLDALVHRVDDAAETTCIDEPYAEPIRENRKVQSEWMDVERQPFRDESSVDLAQDVHDVLGLYSSERPGKERQIELALRELELSRIGDLEADASPQLARRL
jgi:hypothetical protein